MSGAERMDEIERDFEDLPIAALLRAKPLAYDGDRLRFEVAFEADEALCNLMGTVQGGILTAMLDNAMSFAILGALGRGFVAPTLEIKTSYLSPARPGRILGEGRVVRHGRRIAFLEGRLTDVGGNLLATATATAQIRPRAAAATD